MATVGERLLIQHLNLSLEYDAKTNFYDVIAECLQILSEAGRSLTSL